LPLGAGEDVLEKGGAAVLLAELHLGAGDVEIGASVVGAPRLKSRG
jgi:hypothetical protein